MSGIGRSSRNNDARKLENLMALLESAYTTSIGLEDFITDPNFVDHYLCVHIPLLNGKVPVKSGTGYGSVRVVRKSTEYTGDLFEISLKACMEEFTDGRLVTERNRNITLYKGLLIHEAAHILEGSFEPLNLKDIFKEQGNADFAADLFNIFEDYRIEVNLCRKLPHRPDLKVCLDFLNLIVIGTHGKYQDHDFTDMMNMFLRKAKCNKSLGEIIAENPGPRLKRNGNYETVDEILDFEKNFYTKETNQEVQDKYKINTYGGLLEHLVDKVHDLKYKSVVPSVKLIPEIHDIFSTQFPEEAKNYERQKGSGQSGDPDENQGENKGSSSDQGKEGDEPGQGSKAGDDKDDKGKGKKSGTYKPLKGNDDNFDQGAIKPGSMKDLEGMGDKVLNRIKEIAKNLCPEYGERDPDDQRKEDDNYRIIYTYNSEGQQVVQSEVFFEKLEGGDPDLINRIRAAYPGIIDGIRGGFDELKLNQLQVERMQEIPQSFNPVGMVYASIDPNFAAKERYYDASLINKRDYAIYFLIDGSGSTHETLEPEMNSIINLSRKANVLDIEKIAAASIYTSIEDLIENPDLEESFTQKMFIYYSSGWTKIFEVPNVAALTELEYDHANRDGVAIRALTDRLLAEKNEDKILFLFADGMPADSGYENGVYDTSMAIKEAVDQGAKVFYILTKYNENAFGGRDDQAKAFKEVTEHATDCAVVLNPRKLPYVVRDIIDKHLI
jgi:hypothetical protein